MHYRFQSGSNRSFARRTAELIEAVPRAESVQELIQLINVLSSFAWAPVYEVDYVSPPFATFVTERWQNQ